VLSLLLFGVVVRLIVLHLRIIRHDCPTSADYQALTAAINNLSDTMRYVVDEVFTFDPVFFDFLYEQAILFLIAGMSVGLLLFVIRKVRHG